MAKIAVQTEPCETAREVVDALQAINSTNYGDRPQWLGRHWMFRGHRESTWDLHASLHRELLGTTNHEMLHVARASHSVFRFTHSDATDYLLREDWIDRVNKEFAKWIVDFALIASRGALLSGAAAADSTNLLDDLRASDGRISELFPASSPSIVGLAQHHNIPTPLLDWTWSPFVAAWFAAADVHRQHAKAADSVPITEGPRAEVWCVPVVLLERLRRFSIKVIHDQAFARAQDGVFTFDNDAICEFRHSGTISPLDRVIEEHDFVPETWHSRKAGLPSPVRVQFPRHVHRELLHLLAGLGVTGVSLKPSLQNVADRVINPFIP